jgi:GTP-binding protein
LIEGAHEGVGLGHRFLKHIERTSVLLHIINCSSEDDQPMVDFRVLEKELDAYNKELLGRRYVIVLNKIDLIDQERLQAVQNMFESEGLKTTAISAQAGDGIEELKEMLEELFDEIQEQEKG